MAMLDRGNMRTAPEDPGEVNLGSSPFSAN